MGTEFAALALTPDGAGSRFEAAAGRGWDGTGGNWTCRGMVELKTVVLVGVAEELEPAADEAVAVASCFFLWDDLWTMGVPSGLVAGFFAGGVAGAVEDTTVTSSSARAQDAQPSTAATGTSQQNRERAVMLL